MSSVRADLFCRVIDNYGDIGVCWRLARRLAHDRKWRLRLWVDALPAFAVLEPEVDPARARQTVQGIEVVRWDAQAETAAGLTPGDVAIEAFACDPPARYVAGMAAARTVWVNLEYLSAEDWVEGCHGLPSPQPGGQSKYFFFPGFTPGTGGLLHEPGLAAQRDAWQAGRGRAEPLLRRLGMPEAALHAWREGARLVTLFCYPHAPAAALADTLARDARPSVLAVPHGVAPSLQTGVHGASGGVHVVRVPFVPQPEFDRLLWSADLNIVRGEDSFVRALWAARPMVWQLYPQQDDAHLAKLQAWLRRYDPTPEARRLIEAWNLALPEDSGATRRHPDQAARAVGDALPAALAGTAWQAWTRAARAWTDRAMARRDLADSLADFCEKKAQTG